MFSSSALLRVFNDILVASWPWEYDILVLLDLTTAFDTVDHNILLSWLQPIAGICGSLLDWFRSYLVDRTMSVSLARSEFSSAPLSFVDPQGSI